MNTNNKGFSLVELIVVIAIMAILAAVAIPTFAGFIGKANKAADDDFIAGVEYAINLANVTNGDFELKEISVTVGDKGQITKVQYKATGIEAGETTTVEVKENDKTEPNASIASVIDWDYAFKATKNDTVTVKFGAAEGSTEEVTTEEVTTEAGQ